MTGPRGPSSFLRWRVAPWRPAILAVILAVMPALFAGRALAAEPGPSPWFDGRRANALAESAATLLADAESHGLASRDYGGPGLREAVAAAARHGAPPQAVAPLAAALTAAMTRYLRDLHDGRIAPAVLHQRYAVPVPSPYDPQAALVAALAAGDLARAVDAAQPPIAQYRRLREALAAYRALAGHPAWAHRLPALPLSAPPPGGRGVRVRALEPGVSWAGTQVLEARLAALGDLAPGDAPAAPATAGAPGTAAAPGTDSAPGTTSAPAAPIAERPYGAALVAAVQAFQRRHGLGDDGVIGRATLAALEVPPHQRAAQIGLALERLRMTPLVHGPRMIVVNVPEFVLRAYEVEASRGRIAVRAEMKVIVGQALDKRTPLIGEELRSIEFNPFWNVPHSIARDELVPLLRRNPGHWAREGYEFVPTGGAGPADPVLSPAKLDAVLAGSLRIRQRPGPRNALGDIKFVFPNRESIYLHHTPSVSLFERARRDFSHGCVRVEEPVALASFALAGLAGWDDARIRATMAAAEPLTVMLPEAVPVLIAYGTALVKDGRVHFFDDVYGHDRALAAALGRLSRPPITFAAPTP